MRLMHFPQRYGCHGGRDHVSVYWRSCSILPWRVAFHQPASCRSKEPPIRAQALIGLWLHAAVARNGRDVENVFLNRWRVSRCSGADEGCFQRFTAEGQEVASTASD